MPLPDPHSFTPQVWTIFCCSGQAFYFGRHQRFLRDQDPSIPHVYDDSSWRDTILKDFQLRPSCDGLTADCCSVTKSCLTLWSHGLQHAWFPCLSLSPGTCSNSRPLSQWCYPTISSSIAPFSSCFLFPSLRGFPIIWFFASGGQSIGASASASVLPMNIQSRCPLRLTALTSWLSKRLSRVFSITSKGSIFQHSMLFIVQISHPNMTTRKTTALTRWTFVNKMMSLFFNMLSIFVIAFFPRSKCLLISWLQSQSAVILEPKKIKSLIVSIVTPSICHEVMGPDAMILVFWMLSFKPTFSLSSFTFIKRLFRSFSFSAKRVVSFAFLRLLIFLLAILIPACASSSPAFHMMYSAYKLNKQGDNIQPWCTPVPIWNYAVVPCPVLTVASWPAYRFLRRHVKWSGIPTSLRIFQFVVIHTVKGFSIANEP